MSCSFPDEAELADRLRGGQAEALVEAFDRMRERLKRSVRLRMDRRLQGRIDASDVLQEAYLEASKRAADFSRQQMPLFLWLRLITGQKLLELHRHHLGTQMRDAGRELSLCGGALPQVSSASLAEQLLGRLTTASQAAMRAEMQRRLQDAVNALAPIDREILALRHFEELSNDETAQLLEISKSAASNRYIRALKRLKQQMENP